VIKFTQIQNHTCGNSSIRISRERNNRRDYRFFSGGSKILLAFMWRRRGHKGVFVFLDTQKKITQGSLVITNKKLGTLIVPTSLSLTLTLTLFYVATRCNLPRPPSLWDGKKYHTQITRTITSFHIVVPPLHNTPTTISQLSSLFWH